MGSASGTTAYRLCVLEPVTCPLWYRIASSVMRATDNIYLLPELLGKLTEMLFLVQHQIHSSNKYTSAATPSLNLEFSSSTEEHFGTPFPGRRCLIDTCRLVVDVLGCVFYILLLIRGSRGPDSNVPFPGSKGPCSPEKKKKIDS